MISKRKSTTLMGLIWENRNREWKVKDDGESFYYILNGWTTAIWAYYLYNTATCYFS